MSQGTEILGSFYFIRSEQRCAERGKKMGTKLSGAGTFEPEIRCVKRILKLIMLKSGTVLGILDDMLVSC